MNTKARWMVVGLSALFGTAACGDKTQDDSDKKASRAGDNAQAVSRTAQDKGEPKSASSWKKGPPVSLKATWFSDGAESRGTKITGTFYVGPKAVRLDMDNYPGASEASFVRVHGDDAVWSISKKKKSYTRILSGSWEHHMILGVLGERELDRAAEGECPFGSRPREKDTCKKTGSAKVASQDVETWTVKNHKLWVSPELKVVVKDVYTPFRNDPETQSVELTSITVGPQDAALFAMPADYTCNAKAFCDQAPK